MESEKVASSDTDDWLTTASRGSIKGSGKAKRQICFNVFNVPLESLFPGIVLSTIENKETPTDIIPFANVVIGSRFTCRVCGCEFNALQEQHEHFKSQLHVLNLKRSLVGLKTVSHDGELNSDEEFVDDINEALEMEVLGDSPSEVSIGNKNKSFQEGWVMKKNSKINGSVIVFRKHESNWEFSISSAVFGMSLVNASGSEGAEDAGEEDPWYTLKNTLQIFHKGETLHSCVLVLQSGMFAGAVFEGSTCILHKVFRRYTVRAKAGGGQSSFDSNGRKAKSAGATLRRYGEQALKEDIQDLLLSWLPYLQSSVVILTAIPKTMKHYVFSDALQKGFHRDDARVKHIPFMVKKPTFEEIKLVHQKCMLIEFNFIERVGELCALSMDSGTVLPTVTEGCEAPPSLAQEENNGVVNEGDLDSGTQLEPNLESRSQFLLQTVAPDEVCDLLSALMTNLTPPSTLDASTSCDTEVGTPPATTEHFAAIMAAISAAAGEEEPYAQSTWLSAPHTLDTLQTLLHAAAESGRSREVLLLLQAGASPEATDTRGRYPYFLARDKDTRDAFRRYRGGLEDDGKWNWHLCGVPTGITEDMMKDKKEREKEKKRKAKQRKQQAKLEQAEEAAAAEEARKKAVAEEKEREANNYKLVGECGFCHKSLMGIVPLDIFDRRCCSSGCVVLMRRKLTAEAAEKRAQNMKRV